MLELTIISLNRIAELINLAKISATIFDKKLYIHEYFSIALINRRRVNKHFSRWGKIHVNSDPRFANQIGWHATVQQVQ